MKTLLSLVFLLGIVFAQAEPLKTAEGFSLPEPNHVFSFPRDHGSHEDFKIEWWYVTGHLYDAQNRRYGFQATFFRRSNTAGDALPHSVNFGGGQWFLGHMAFSDLSEGHFFHEERLNRDGWDAAAATDRLSLRNGPWSLAMNGDGSLLLKGGVRADVRFELTLVPKKNLVIFGENGVSRKGADPTASSYYLTWPRLEAKGELDLGNGTRNVTGEAWMDHEISSSQLASNQVGWDWISIQLKDGRELMVYRMRLRDGTADPASVLYWIAGDGTTQATPFRWEPQYTWKSPKTGASYPSKVVLKTMDPKTSKTTELTIAPLMFDQELEGGAAGNAYWEGACRVLDETGLEVGSAFMELTGYASDLMM